MWLTKGEWKRRALMYQDMITGAAETREANYWKAEAFKYLRALNAQQKGLQRQARKIHRLRNMLISNGINPDSAKPGAVLDLFSLNRQGLVPKFVPLKENGVYYELAPVQEIKCGI